jgi:hypothetical protein
MKHATGSTTDPQTAGDIVQDLSRPADLAPWICAPLHGNFHVYIYVIFNAKQQQQS